MSGGTNRLPPPRGLLVDRDRPLSFRFEGRTYEGFAGDTIASALAANDRWILSRSFKYHRPRGIVTMAGEDANTLVQLVAEPNVLADRHPISDGLEVMGQNYRGSLEDDRTAVLDRLARFLPVGFYYRTFYGPGKGSWTRFWEPIIRRSAGLGRINLDPPRRRYDKAYLFHDLVVVGGGPAGMAAALTAAGAGADVLLVDENPVLGGALAYARFDVDGTVADTRKRELVAAVEAEPGIRVLTDAVCNGWFADNWLPVIRGDRMYKVRAKEVVVAAGTIEQPAVFRNNDLPGIMMGGAAQRLIRLYGIRPGRRAVVLTANADGYGVALDLDDAGVEVAAIVDMRPEPGPSELASAAADRGLPVVPGHCIGETRGTRGNRHVAAVAVTPLGDDGVPVGGPRWQPCDLVCVSVGAMPAYQLPLQAGARLDYDDTKAAFAITGTPDHLDVAGSAGGTAGLEGTLADGRRAGRRAARALGLEAGEDPPHPMDSGEPRTNHPWPIFPHPRGKDFVDFDEDLQVRDILNTLAEGFRELELVKRFSTVGMGPSQGRLSALTTARLVARETGRTVSEVGVTTARPPFAAEKLGVLAGRPYQPERLTPMHHRHLERGARMIPAGLWWRPAYYGPKDRAEAVTLEEYWAVRECVAMLDVSTLGGLEVRGPDAAELLERMYTFTYAKQKVGRGRYLLMTNEMGSVIDDGMACRFADDHFYVTSTTGAVDGVYRAMLWWNAQWLLDVDVASVTAAYAAVNLTGPKARAVLASVVEGVDVGAEALPYLGVREGRVAGVSARIMRFGFTGELAYEIHVPTSSGEALWDRLLEAGAPHGLRPYGLEASRILRLEKGHIIIGQDTDAMSTPDELALTWAVGKHKPFFVGARSLELRRRRPSKRKLVGFTLDDPKSPLPGESNLVIRDGAPVGLVTSVCRSPVLERVIGLAYTDAGEAEVGDPVRIRLASGRIIEARVASPHFYDAENTRQAV